jgi:deazaflavin-dependent oxidoreductase (nitroreductase family)
MNDSAGPHYQKPGTLTRRLANPLVVGLMRLGVSVWGGRILEHRGRRSGELHRTPVNLLEFEGRQYLVAPRGEAQWVRNVRADDGRLTLILGRRRDERTAEEIPDSEKPPILRAYLRRWKMEVGVFFGGVSADSSDEELQRIAPNHPVFRLSQPSH